jgi:Ca2+-binding EF-hand superfamily protein|tara:strand:- start:325 stop:903 length:579 start_codon:yes stop_codon:yes gene_type:complete
LITKGLFVLTLFDSFSFYIIVSTQSFSIRPILGAFMQEMAHHDGHGAMSQTELDSAVSFIMKAADADNSGSIDEKELMFAVSAWKNWSHSATRLSEKVKELMTKYDKDSSGSLDKAQFTSLLKELNEGIEVAEEEVDKIIKGADKRGNGAIDMEEIYPALALWFQIDDTDEDIESLVIVKATGCHIKGCTLM